MYLTDLYDKNGGGFDEQSLNRKCGKLLYFVCLIKRECYFCIVSDFGVSDDMDIVDFRVKLYK